MQDAMIRTAKILFCAMTAFSTVSCATRAVEIAETHACFDALVSAKIIKEVPSDTPDCGPDCIVVRWPWFIDLKVERVLKGHVPSRKLSVLAVLHTDLTTEQPLTWSLRRNKDGGFNADPFAEKGATRCKSTDEPVEAYLRTAEGQTLDELRQAGARNFDRE
jgi:hypothetical protein